MNGGGASGNGSLRPAFSRSSSRKARGGKGKPRRNSEPTTFSGGVAALFLIAAWILLAPSQVGGWVSYVIVNGDSMEPDFRKGDLVITREKPPGGYEVGDVIAYRHPEIGPVIHRVVDRDDDRFILKGDNNSWLDSHQPVETEVMGKSWIHVPSAGKFLGAMHSPVGIFALSLTMGVIVMMSFSTATDKNKKNRKNTRPNLSSLAKGSGPPGKSSGDVEGLAALLGAILLASLLLGFLAFSRPASVPVSGDVGFRNTGEFEYSASAPADIYQEGAIRSGEPVFRRITDEVNVAFDYRLDSGLPTDGVEGTYSLDAKVGDVNGWSRTINLQPETPFSGGEFTASGVLDLAEIQETTSTLENRTGLSTDRFSVAIVPKVALGGELGGQPVEDEFSPSLDFWLDSVQMQLQTPIAASGAASGSDATSLGGADETAANPLTPSEDGSAASSAMEGSKLSILGFEIGVATARITALLGAAAAALGLVRFGLPALRARRSADEPTRILAKHGASLVSVSGPVHGPVHGREDEAVVTLSTFDDLAKVAEMAGQRILHHDEDGGPAHDYYVLDSEAIYRYRAVAEMEGGGKEGEAGKPFVEMVREMWR